MNSRIITSTATALAFLASLTFAEPAVAGVSNPFTQRFYVDSAAPTLTGDGASWGTSFRYLQDGLTAAQTFLETSAGPVEIWVARGTQRPDQSAANPSGSNDRSVSFRLLDQVTLFGGFAGTEEELSERVLFDATNETVLSAEIGAPGIDDNSYHVVVGSTSNNPPSEPHLWATLNGFTLTGGNANAGNVNVDFDGGGFMSYQGMQVLANNRIVGNRADRYGGGVSSIAGAILHLHNCTIESNEALKGGGIGIRDGSQEGLMIHQCLIKDNVAVGTEAIGGGIYIESVFIRIFQSTLVGNSAPKGGAVYSETGGMIINSIMNGNESGDGLSDSVYLEGSTFISVQMHTSAMADTPGQVFPNYTVVGTLVTGDPQFVDPDSGDYRLKLTSPCGDLSGFFGAPKDGGDIDQDGDLLEALPLDLALQPRTQGVTHDIGAFEASSVVSSYCDSGANSVSASGARIGAYGSLSLAARDLTFTAGPVPATPGLFILGMTQIQNPFGDGFLCAGGEKNRLAPMFAVDNMLVYEVDWDSNTIQAELQVGEVRQVQAWYRDPFNGGAGFNTSNAMTITVQP